jgi:hypothetical protein
VSLGKGSVSDFHLASKRYPNAVERWRCDAVLIIDEISMLGADFFTKLNVTGAFDDLLFLTSDRVLRHILTP